MRECAPLAEFLYSQGQKIATDREATASALSRKLEQIQEAAARKTGNGTVRSKGKVDTTSGVVIEGKHFEGIQGKKLSGQQNAIVKMVNNLADALNIDYVIYYGDAEGVQGVYRKGGQIFLNINAGGKRALAAETLSHELTHFIEDFAKAEYEALRSFVVETMMKNDEETFNEHVKKKMSQLDPAFTGDKRDAAIREVVADACTVMLKNSQAVTELARQNMSVAEKIRDFIDESVEKLK